MRHRLDALVNDASYAVRQLRRSPAFTVTVMLAFAFGIGANATMFGIVDQLMFRPIEHVSAPEEIVTFSAVSGDNSIDQRTLNFPVYTAIRDYSVGFSQAAAVANLSVPFGRGDRASKLDGQLVTASYFELLGVTPMQGRFFDEKDDVMPVGAPVVVISHAFRQRQFPDGADPIGATLQLGDRQFTVIGITPPGFTGLNYAAPDVWLPISSGGAMQFLGNRWSTHSVVTWLRIYARIKPGIPRAAANLDAMRVARDAAPEAFFTQPGWRFETAPIMTARSEEHGANAIVATVLAAMSLMVLLIACANVANLLLARGMRRRREMAVRLALGVSPKRLISQLMTESLLLAALGGAAAVIVANWCGVFVRRLLLVNFKLPDQTMDGRVVIFIAFAAVLVGVFTGLVPALQASRADVLSAMGSSSRGGARRLRAQGVLLAVQATLSLVLLVGAGLFGRSLLAVNAMRLGVDIDHVLVGSMDLRSVGRQQTEAEQIFARALEQVVASPGVQSAAIAVTVPFGPSYGREVGVAGRDSLHHYTVMSNAVTPGFFATIGARLLSGRDFAHSDNETSSRVVVINETLAKRAWPGVDPVGRCLRVDSDTLPCATIIGVVENVRRQSIFEDSSNFVYLPLSQARGWISERHIVARASDDPSAAVSNVRQAMQNAAPLLPYADVRLLKNDRIVLEETLPFRLGAAMLGGFGLLALLLAAVGVYGVVSYDVGQRTREIGVRLAVGARAADVLALVMRDGLRQVFIGGAVGTIIALACGGLVLPLLYETSPRDPVVLVGVAILLLIVAAIACLGPARRAMRIDINSAIREE